MTFHNNLFRISTHYFAQITLQKLQISRVYTLNAYALSSTKH